MRQATLFILVFGLCCSAQETEQNQTPTRIQISSTTVDHSTLPCTGGTAQQATVTVQIWIIPDPPQRPRGQFLTIGLYEAFSNPPGNRLKQEETKKQVEVRHSPAILEYKLECGYDTKPGDISFTAHIESAPAGFEVVRPDPPENGMVKIHVK